MLLRALQRPNGTLAIYPLGDFGPNRPLNQILQRELELTSQNTHNHGRYILFTEEGWKQVYQQITPISSLTSEGAVAGALINLLGQGVNRSFGLGWTISPVPRYPNKGMTDNPPYYWAIWIDVWHRTDRRMA